MNEEGKEQNGLEEEEKTDKREKRRTIIRKKGGQEEAETEAVVKAARRRRIDPAERNGDEVAKPERAEPPHLDEPVIGAKEDKAAPLRAKEADAEVPSPPLWKRTTARRNRPKPSLTKNSTCES